MPQPTVDTSRASARDDVLPAVSVVVPTRNRVGNLPGVLEPLLADPATAEIVVAVDGSADGTLEYLDELAGRDERVRPLPLPGVGAAEARQAGIEVARGEVILLLDDDVVADPGLVSGHARHHADGGRRVVVGYMPTAVTEQRRAGDFSTRLYAAEYEGHCRRWEREPDTILQGLWTGNVSMRADDLRAVGFASTSFPPGLRSHDRDFGLRCLRAGLDAVFDRSLSSTHTHHRSVDAFLADAYAHGGGAWTVRHLHGDLLPPGGVREAGQHLRPLARIALRVLDIPGVHAAVIACGVVVVRAAGAARWWKVEETSAKALRRLQLRRGALDAARRARGRVPVLFLAWAPVEGRSHEIADALGGRSACIYDRSLTGAPVRTMLRYAKSALETVLLLARTQPAAVIVTNPPVFPGLIVAGYAAVTRRPFVLDSHPTAFGAKDHAMSRRMLPLHRWLARRARGVLVTAEQWADVVTSWGGTAVVVHEAPAAWPRQAAPESQRPKVLFVGTFASDEPVDEVVAAAAKVPHADVLVTGDLRRIPENLARALPQNVELVGFLPFEEYQRLVLEAQLVVTLTTEPTSVMRAAYEAVYARRPLLVSDWPLLRELFPYAIFASNEAGALADAIGDALARRDELLARAEDAVALQHERWLRQLAQLRALLSRAV